MATLRLGELLIQEGLLTPSQLEQALTAQHVFGGRLGTNLVEQGFVSEEDLARVLSRQLGIRMVRPHEVSAIDGRVLALIPADVARKYQVVPFGHDVAKDRVSVAVADPGNLQKIDELQFALSRKVDFAICPEVMLAWALEKYYGIERARRYIRVAGLADAELKLDARDRPGAQGGAKVAHPAPGRGRSRDEILRRVVDAATKRELIGATVDVLSGFCGEIVFFVVKGDDLLGWDARGLPSTDEIHRIVVPLAGSPLARQVLEGRHQVVSRVDDPALAAALQRLTGFDTRQPIFLLPLIVNRKGFGLCVMGDLGQGFAEQEPLLVEIMKRVACKLQIFFLGEYLSAPL